MAKPITHFVLAKNGYRYASRGFRVIGVTSVKGRQVYGRELPGDNATHISQWDVIHTFPEGTTLEHALASIDRAEKEYTLHSKDIQEAQVRARDLSEFQKIATEAAAKGERCVYTKTPPSPADAADHVQV